METALQKQKYIIFRLLLLFLHIIICNVILYLFFLGGGKGWGPLYLYMYLFIILAIYNTDKQNKLACNKFFSKLNSLTRFTFLETK